MQNRENLMLKLEEFRKHLCYDRIEESLFSLREALSFYEKPEIYDGLDIELIHFIIQLDDTLTFEKRSKVSKEIKKILSNFKNSNIPFWLLDAINLTLASFPNSDDPKDVLSLRKLIEKHPTSMELRLALALALVQDSIEKNTEFGFKESLNLFSDLAPLFSKNEELSSRFRIYFPINPEMLFVRLRMWALINYSSFLQNHERDEEAIQMLISQSSEDWIRLASNSEKTQFQTEIKILQRGQRITESIGLKSEEKLKHWIAILVGVPFFASMMGGLLAGSHLTYSEIAKLIVEIALATLLIMSISLILLGSKKRKKNIPLFTSILFVSLFFFMVEEPAANMLSNFKNIAAIVENTHIDTDLQTNATSSQHTSISMDDPAPSLR